MGDDLWWKKNPERRAQLFDEMVTAYGGSCTCPHQEVIESGE